MTIASHALALVLVSAPLAACSERENQAPQETAPMKEIVIPVDGMACGSCANRVKKTLGAIDGVGDTQVSVDDKSVVTHYDPRKLSPDRIVAAINGLGFKAGKPMEASR